MSHKPNADLLAIEHFASIVPKDILAGDALSAGQHAAAAARYALTAFNLHETDCSCGQPATTRGLCEDCSFAFYAVHPAD